MINNGRLSSNRGKTLSRVISDETWLILLRLRRAQIKIVDAAKQTGMNRNPVTLLYSATAQQIYLDTIEKLCKLFQCEVGELLKFEQDE